MYSLVFFEIVSEPMHAERIAAAERARWASDPEGTSSTARTPCAERVEDARALDHDVRSRGLLRLWDKLLWLLARRGCAGWAASSSHAVASHCVTHGCWPAPRAERGREPAPRSFNSLTPNYGPGSRRGRC